MKTFRLNLALLTLVATTHASLSHADGMDMGGMNMNGMPMPETTKEKAGAVVHHASGIVRKVDMAAGRVTISHGPIATIPWPAMTMGFAVKDRKMLNHVTVGEQVNFDLLPTGQDQFVVVRITPVSP